MNYSVILDLHKQHLPVCGVNGVESHLKISALLTPGLTPSIMTCSTGKYWPFLNNRTFPSWRPC